MSRIIGPYDRVNSVFAKDRKIIFLERELKRLKEDFDKKEMTLVALFLKAMEKLGGTMVVTREEFVGIHERLFVKVSKNDDGTATYQLLNEQPRPEEPADEPGTQPSVQ